MNAWSLNYYHWNCFKQCHVGSSGRREASVHRFIGTAVHRDGDRQQSSVSLMMNPKNPISQSSGLSAENSHREQKRDQSARDMRDYREREMREIRDMVYTVIFPCFLRAILSFMT